LRTLVVGLTVVPWATRYVSGLKRVILLPYCLLVVEKQIFAFPFLTDCSHGRADLTIKTGILHSTGANIAEETILRYVSLDTSFGSDFVWSFGRESFRVIGDRIAVQDLWTPTLIEGSYTCRS
jgi:hypothetical protein